ncbi:MAG: aminotransferase class V-fold PLP-dependent enzyme [Bacteroidetes bacterium]|nr:aminotransferase class V-fold PLP-dependent enzyme [Bacteroidota bacterium]
MTSPIKPVDLRSDTVTRPSPEMLEAMFNAKVGDDVLEEDQTVNQLESKAADMFGMEAGIFCPSGTMTNQIAIKLFTQPGDEVVCDSLSHIYNYEGGGIAFNSGASVKLLNGNKGRFTASDVLENIHPDNVHFPRTSLVSIENTSNRGGGCCWDFQEIIRIQELCKANKLFFHLDGARIFNALEETTETAADYGKVFDSISVCLSKGLGSPVGSVLLGNKEMIKRAKRFRKVMGGGMRQAGYLAAAGIYALDYNIQRLKEDHLNAKILGDAVSELDFVNDVFPIETNIVVFKLDDSMPSEKFIKLLDEKGVKVVPFGKQTIRMVTHLDVLRADVEFVQGVVVKLAY